MEEYKRAPFFVIANIIKVVIEGNLLAYAAKPLHSLSCRDTESLEITKSVTVCFPLDRRILRWRTDAIGERLAIRTIRQTYFLAGSRFVSDVAADDIIVVSTVISMLFSFFAHKSHDGAKSFLLS